MKIICLLAAHLPVQVEQQVSASDTVPLIVGGRPWDPGVVLDCSSAALPARVRLGMRLARAAQVCPGATFIPAREAVYRISNCRLITGRWVEGNGYSDVIALRSPTQKKGNGRGCC